MTLCGSCGKDIPAGAKFCGICGHPMESSAPLQAQDPIQGIPGQTNFFKAAAEVDRESQIRRILKGVIMLAVVILGLLGLLAFIFTQQDRPRGIDRSQAAPGTDHPVGEQGKP